MFTIQIHDEQLARRLQQISEREQRPVEDILKTMVAQYPAEAPVEAAQSDMSEAVKLVRRKAYAKARLYWLSVGDAEKAAMTDEALDEAFGAFDEEGIPRLKVELSSEPPIGSLAYAAKVIREHGGVRTEGTLDVTQADDILNAEFADYLLNRMKDSDASQ
ncbi:MAG: hypothetical protein JNJ61_05050 [Anaerolineae bacterium]|nr:hypothetical protein [Anaerolineae bacterium]